MHYLLDQLDQSCQKLVRDLTFFNGEIATKIEVLTLTPLSNLGSFFMKIIVTSPKNYKSSFLSTSIHLALQPP